MADAVLSPMPQTSATNDSCTAVFSTLIVVKRPPTSLDGQPPRVLSEVAVVRLRPRASPSTSPTASCLNESECPTADSRLARSRRPLRCTSGLSMSSGCGRRWSHRDEVGPGRRLDRVDPAFDLNLFVAARRSSGTFRLDVPPLDWTADTRTRWRSRSGALGCRRWYSSSVLEPARAVPAGASIDEVVAQVACDQHVSSTTYSQNAGSLAIKPSRQLERLPLARAGAFRLHSWPSCSPSLSFSSRSLTSGRQREFVVPPEDTGALADRRAWVRVADPRRRTENWMYESGSRPRRAGGRSSRCSTG